MNACYSNTEWNTTCATCETEREELMPKYGKAAQKSVERAVHKEKEGTLKSGRSGKTVTSQKQAVAIGLSEAREKGAKVPSRKSKRS
jgi:hypothetical protein